MELWTASLDAALRRRLAPLQASRVSRLDDLPASAEAFLLWAAARATGRCVVWVGDGPQRLDAMRRDLATLAPPDAPPLLHVPNWEAYPAVNAPPPRAAITGDRLAALLALGQPGAAPPVVVTCVQALLERTLTPEGLTADTLTLRVGHECELERATAQLSATGYRFVPEVTAPGEAALRGGILDVWPVTEARPLRLEFVGNTVESLRVFEADDQRSHERRDHVRLPPAGEWPSLLAGRDAHPFHAHLPHDAVVVWSDIASIAHHGAVHETSARETHAESYTLALDAVREHFAAMPGARELYVGAPPEEECAVLDLGIEPLAAVPPTAGGTRPDLAEEARNRFLDTLVERTRTGATVRLYFDTAGALARFRETHGRRAEIATLATQLGPLSEGFAAPALGLVVACEADLYGARLRRRLRPAREAREGVQGARLSDWTDIEPGQLVVHAEHGIGRYLGLREIVVNARRQEVLALEYAEGARLYVPVTQAHLLSRYVGLRKGAVELHQLGGKRWMRERLAAENAVQDLASALLETQAARTALDGLAMPPDSPWQHELEAAFPYEETEDQQRAIVAVKADMESHRPMDRLICGDAGYGKTEVAVRAAFKAVMAGKQVAVLVPTTVLAQQHFQTFSERVSAFPVQVEMLSRFVGPAAAARTLRALREGHVDIVIGTHALLQSGVEFKDLGLVIIDEEQRFGVRHKERFKHLRRSVDVLTLTATPIPRTLYLSLTGAKDMSTIQTPPQDRLPVETIVAPASDAVIREAILRELNREGQAFYLHNRVGSIERARERLRRLVPEARIEVGHGQMAAGHLAEVMEAFAAGTFDVLLCTTIIESGLDIPNANTILIDRADRFGLGELYQLRGRVGRAKQKGYAYMLLPGGGFVDPVARKRIQAIKHYSGTGSGFRLALRDLEIRGAGNLLGAEQSGHISTVGFALYCQLLRRTVARLKGEPLPPIIDVEVRLDFLGPAGGPADEVEASLPAGYIEEERLRVQLYRRIAEASYGRELHELEAGLRDRFGALPVPAVRLLKLARLRILAAGRGIQSVQVENGKIMLQRHGQYVMTKGHFPRLAATTPDAQLDELLRHLGHRPANENARAG